MTNNNGRKMLELLGIQVENNTTGWFESEDIVYFLEKFDGNLINSPGKIRFKFDFIGNEFVVFYKQVKSRKLISSRFNRNGMSINTNDKTISILNCYGSNLRYVGLTYKGQTAPNISVGDLVYTIDKNTLKATKLKAKVSSITFSETGRTATITLSDSTVLNDCVSKENILCYVKAYYLNENNPESDNAFFNEKDNSIMEEYTFVSNNDFDGMIGGSYIQGVHLHRARDSKR